jgi:hypothetical protein
MRRDPILIAVADDKKRRKRTKKSSGGSKKPRTAASTSSARYTPPTPSSYKSSSKWVPIFMFGFFGLGVVMMLLNYLPGNLLPGGSNNWYLLGGLGLILLGFGAATRYR